MSAMADNVISAAEKAVVDANSMEELVETLGSSSRRSRQNAAQVLSVVAKRNIELLVPFVSDIVDALSRPEAQTRWECFDILTRLVDRAPEQCEQGILEAESALFDEGSGALRLASMRFLCKIGATSVERSDKVWSVVDEGIQCYRGDSEFQDMLSSVVEFSEGNLSEAVRKQLSARMKFDAANSKGVLQRKAQQIIENLK